MAFAKAYKILDVQTFPRSEQIAPSSRSTISSRKKSARELRQRRSDYRCCIPALAGFVSPQSIAPDGGKTFAQDHHPATATRKRSEESDEIRMTNEFLMTKSETVTRERGVLFRRSGFVIVVFPLSPH